MRPDPQYDFDAIAPSHPPAPIDPPVRPPVPVYPPAPLHPPAPLDDMHWQTLDSSSNGMPKPPNDAPAHGDPLGLWGSRKPFEDAPAPAGQAGVFNLGIPVLYHNPGGAKLPLQKIDESGALVAAKEPSRSWRHHRQSHRSRRF